MRARMLQNVRCEFWTPTRMCVVTTSLHIPCELNTQTQPSQQECLALLKTAESKVLFLQTIWCCLHLLIRVFNMQLLGFQLRATKPG